MLDTLAPPDALSPRAYAAHRAALGLGGTALLAVQRAIKTGRLDKSIALDHKGHAKIVNPALADQEWEANTRSQMRPVKDRDRAAAPQPPGGNGGPPPKRPRGRPRKNPLPGDRPPPIQAVPAAQAGAPDDEARVPRNADGSIAYELLNIADAGRVKAMWQAKDAELNYRARVGELIEVSEVERGWANIVSQSRTKLLAVPAKIKARRAHLTAEDVAAVEDAIREALDELANKGAADGEEAEAME